MIVLSADQVVLADRVLAPGALTIDGDRIVDIRPGRPSGGAASPAHAHCIVAGFVDVHVHGVAGFDVLDEGEPIAAIAARLPQYGVTAFCPTTVACSPVALQNVLRQVARTRSNGTPGARVLPAHLESNFINPVYRGAQPAACLRSPRPALNATPGVLVEERGDSAFEAEDILREIDEAGLQVGIVTLAPELDGALDLIGWLCARGHRVSLGHSAATFEEGLAAVSAGARHATHLFNRMPPLSHRAPGLVGAVLHSDEVVAELICDGVHVHPSMMRLAIGVKRPAKIMAITDGTAASELPSGSVAHLGGQRITATESAAFLPDGTLAGSVLTMDAAFRVLVQRVGCSLIEAATMCAATPAHELDLAGCGVLASGAVADVVVFDADLQVLQTYVGGRLAYARIRNGDFGIGN